MHAPSHTLGRKVLEGSRAIALAVIVFLLGTAEKLAWASAFPARLFRGVKREFLTP